MVDDHRSDAPDRRLPVLIRPTFWGDHPDSLAPYVPSPINVVREMLSLASVGPNDIVYDLGCGDGRVLFTAVNEFNVAKAVGYELDQELVEDLEKHIRDSGMVGRISVINKNFMEANLTKATVVTIYLTTSGNAKLRPKLEADLKPGARVVSHDFPVQGWVTDKINGTSHNIGNHKMFLYRIPEAYTKKIKVHRTDEEEESWRRMRDMFIRLERVQKLSLSLRHQERER